jgi:hypothetical protein
LHSFNYRKGLRIENKDKFSGLEEIDGCLSPLLAVVWQLPTTSTLLVLLVSWLVSCLGNQLGG